MADTSLPGVLLEGDHASRPAAADVASGTLYSCSTHGLVYQSDLSTWATWATMGGGAPAAHDASHENAGGDEISVAGLSGLLADGQTPLAHKTSHQDGGSDEISLTGLAGESVTPQPPKTHAASHDGGADDLNGALTPNAHAASHQNGGSDEIDVTGLTGAGGGGGAPTLVRKPSNEVVVSSTTLQNDNDFVFAIDASEIWIAQLHLYLQHEADATTDFKLGWAVPAGATVRYGAIGLAVAATGVEGSGRFQSHVTAGSVVLGTISAAAADTYAIVSVSVANSATPGNVQFQWAQNASDADDLIVLAGSFMIAHKVA